jgi:sugar phosphate isomerase/epimerase
MLLIVSSSTFRDRLKKGKLALDDLPRHVHEEHGLRGLSITADLLAGADMRRLDALREAADKAVCPILMLQENAVQNFSDAETVDEAAQRVSRVLHAAQRLGCSAVGIELAPAADEDAMERVVEGLKEVSPVAEKLDLNLLVRVGKTPVATPDEVSELIKRIGGFRVGTLPDFELACETGDGAEHLKRVAPYSTVVIAATTGFKKTGGHKAYDLGKLIEALSEIGFDGALAIEHRGAGDADEALRMAREEIEAALEKV